MYAPGRAVNINCTRTNLCLSFRRNEDFAPEGKSRERERERGEGGEERTNEALMEEEIQREREGGVGQLNLRW